VIDAIKRSSAWEEFSANKRLQWMVVGIVFILIISISKSMFDLLDERHNEAMRTHAMLERMIEAASRPVSDSAVLKAEELLENLRSNIPVVASASIAEAEALSAGTKIINTAIARARSRLIGTETLVFGDTTYWQVRIKIDGGLHELNLIKLLEFFEEDYPHIRLYSFDFQPDSKGVVSLVVDYLYQQGSM